MGWLPFCGIGGAFDRPSPLLLKRPGASPGTCSSNTYQVRHQAHAASIPISVQQ
jgi:hypothetical protein